ncbi:MAG: response regulator [Desulfobacterota bacterium]|nr:response regulator [Thermodesulfobacteriota bacterium]
MPRSRKTSPARDHNLVKAYEEALRDASCQLEEKIQELSLLRRIADITGSIYDLNLFCRCLVDLVIEETNAMNCSLFLADQNECRLYLKAARGRNDDGSLYDCDITGEASFDIGQGVAGRVALLKDSILIADTSADARFELRYTRDPIGSLLCVPLLFENIVIGVINLSHPSRHFFTENSRRLMHIACNMGGKIIGSALRHLQSEHRFRAMFEGVPFAIIIIDTTNDKIIDCNPFTEQCLGYSKDELLQCVSILDIIAPNQRSMLAQIKHSHNESSVHELSFLKKNGDVCICEVTMGRLIFENKPMFRLSAIDISEKKMFEKKLYQMEKLKSLGELASGVAHDVNNMLSAIIGRVELATSCIDTLKRSHNDTALDALLRHLAVIDRAAHDGAETVRRIQNFSRMEQPVQYDTPVDIADVIHDAIEFTRIRWQDQAASRGCTVALHTTIGELKPVIGNAAELREVLVNLINNAIDAMPNGGDIYIDATLIDDSVQISVTDTGPGIPESIRDRLFDPFFTTKDIGSTGLGLSISYGIIKRHHGMLEVTSPPGSGARFCITLPIATADTPVPPPTEQVSIPTRKRILLIEDDPHVNETLVEMLSSAGHNVVCAQNGHEGIKRFADALYDVVITDLGMPGMNGFELSRRIKERRPQQPVILITGWELALTPEELKSRGVDQIITKPFQLQQILTLLSHISPTHENNC